MKTHCETSRVSVIGSGYIGLVAAACLASKGHTTVCVDTDPAKVEQINSGCSPIFEEGLEALLAGANGRLRATTNLEAAVNETDVSLVAVGTPFDGERIDLSQISSACRQLGRALRDKHAFHVVVIKSTVVPGTTDDLVIPILEEMSGKRSGVDFGVAVNPEFLRQGEAVHDFLHPDRLVIGAGDTRTVEVVAQLYRDFQQCPLVVTTTKTAEMIKYTANALLATLISFSNEMANLCGALAGVDAVEVMRGVHLDRRFTVATPSGERIAPGMLKYLEGGCGFGGSCFPKDVKALVAHGRELGARMRVLEAVLGVNSEQPNQLLGLLLKHFDQLARVRVAVLGLAFKPGTDDMRESPAIPVVRFLLEQGAIVTAYDPAARDAAARLFGPRVELCSTVGDTVGQADAILVLTSWPEFRDLPQLVSARDPQPLVVDGRRIFTPQNFGRYEGIGANHGRTTRLAEPIAAQ
jgi:UDPglucose 6-dehydrogenase